MKQTVLADGGLFNKMGLAHMHDAVLGGCGLSLSDEALKRLFVSLPARIREEARQWGLSDTPVRDAICAWAEQNAATVASCAG